MKKLLIDNFNAFLSAVSKAEKLYIPTDCSDGEARFAPYKEGMAVSEKLNTVRSAKDFFFPQTENIAHFKTQGKNIEIIDVREECEDFIVFGVKACDARSFSILDKVFLADPVDTYYENRRNHGTIISLACSYFAETCFCTAIGINPLAPEGDVAAYKTQNAYYFKAITEKGEKFINKFSPFMVECSEDCLDEFITKTKQKFEKLPLKDVNFKAVSDMPLKELFGSEKWAELSQSCIGCGTCTYVCPTCQCFDIKDFNTGHGVIRYRCWDSCMYSDFTKMSAGQPRPTQKERFRQRFMHKLKYFPENNQGEFGCVGCGRCLQKCPIHMNIVKVAKTVVKEDK